MEQFMRSGLAGRESAAAAQALGINLDEISEKEWLRNVVAEVEDQVVCDFIQALVGCN